MAEDSENKNVGEKGEVSPEVQAISDKLTNRMLKDFISRLEEQKIKLLLNIKEYKTTLDQTREDQTDIYYYLNKKLDDNYELIASLENQILSEQNDREIQEKIYEKKIEELESQIEGIELKYTDQMNQLEDQLTSLKDFTEQKEDMETQLKKLLDTLEKERTQFRLATEEMELKTMKERERLRNEFQQNMKELISKAEADSIALMDTKTKQTYEDNLKLRDELKYSSDKVKEVLKMNTNISERDRELRAEVELAQSAEAEMIQKLAEYQKLIKSLNQKNEIEIGSRDEETNSLKAKLESKDATIDALQNRIEELEDDLDVQQEQQGELWSFLSQSYHRMTYLHGKPRFDIKELDIEVDRDRILSGLIKMILQKYPGKFKEQIKHIGRKERGSENNSLSLPSLSVRQIQGSGDTHPQPRSIRMSNDDGMSLQTIDVIQGAIMLQREGQGGLNDQIDIPNQLYAGDNVSFTSSLLDNIGNGVIVGPGGSDDGNIIPPDKDSIGSKGSLNSKKIVNEIFKMQIKTTSTSPRDIGGGGSKRSVPMKKSSIGENIQNDSKSVSTSYSRRMQRMNRYNLKQEAKNFGFKEKNDKKLNKVMNLMSPIKQSNLIIDGGRNRPSIDSHDSGDELQPHSSNILSVSTIKRPEDYRPNASLDTSTITSTLTKKTREIRLKPVPPEGPIPLVFLADARVAGKGGKDLVPDLAGMVEGREPPRSAHPRDVHSANASSPSHHQNRMAIANQKDMVDIRSGEDLNDDMSLGSIPSLGVGSVGSPESSVTLSPRAGPSVTTTNTEEASNNKASCVEKEKVGVE